MDRSRWMMKVLVSTTVAAFIFLFVAGVALKITLVRLIAVVLFFLTFGLTYLIYARSICLWLEDIAAKMLETLGLRDSNSPPKPVAWPFSLSASVWITRAIGIFAIIFGLVLIWLLIEHRAELAP